MIVDVGGVKLNVVVEGEGPDVLLIHGFPDNHEVWRNQIPALVAAGYRVIAPDTRGCGDSDMPKAVDDYKIGKLVGDLVGLLDALEVKQVKLIAHDWGAVICWFLCLRYPERIERYIALSVGHPDSYVRGGVMQKFKGYYVLLLQLRGIAEWLGTRAGWRPFRLMTGNHPEFTNWHSRLSRPGRLTAAMNYYRANLGLLLSRRFGRVRVPTLGVWSSGDYFLTERQMTNSARYVDADWRYRRVDGVSHWLQLDAPDEINGIVLDYLRSPIHA